LGAVKATAPVNTTKSRQSRAAACLYFGLGFLMVLLLLHAPILNLPYFWDEMGQFIPASLDLFHDGAWIAHSTLPNIHPPAVMAYLAAVWKVTGYSIVVTRIAMLLLAAIGMLLVFLLAIELLGPLQGAPALIPVVLLGVSPLFYMQSMMAQLDMPAMVFTLLALLLFLQDRFRLSALACIVLVLTKETGVLVPLLFAASLVFERRLKTALWYLIPCVALAAWLLYLRHGTGSLFGNRDFEHYNLFFPLHPMRLSLTFLRRISYLFIENFHWVGAAAIFFAFRLTRIFRSRAWAITGALFVSHTLLVTVFGGAALERYLLPILPVFYIAVAAAWTTLTPVRRHFSQALMIAGLLFGIFWNPPWPFPYENNAAAVDFVRLQETAAAYVEANYPGQTIASAWPFPDALRRPEFGYVTHPLNVIGIEDFHVASVIQAAPKMDVLVVYSRTWEPRYSILHIPAVTKFLTRYYFYEPQITTEQIQQHLGLTEIISWQRRSQWIAIYARDLPAPAIRVRLRARHRTTG
jgi:4-amino-4-deoxy-L-arabinose transferase-like glycosyltransferase